MGLNEEIRKELEKSHSIFDIKNNLIRRGYLESDIEKSLKGLIESKTAAKSKNEHIFGIKELFDRIGYGFASQQFVNILFMFSGANLFMIGFFNGFRTALTSLFSGFLTEYAKVKHIGKNIISTSGIIYGFSFLGMTIAVMLQSPWFFVLSLLIGSLGVIAHGDLYMEFMKGLLKTERRIFLRFISYFGILITAGSLLLAGLIMQLIPLAGIGFTIHFPESDWQLKIFGHLLIFEITAIMFIVSGYIMSLVKEERERIMSSDHNMFGYMRTYLSDAFGSYKIFAKNKKIYLLSIATILTTVMQVVGSAYYGVFIYTHFKSEFLGGFLNVAVVFVIALLASLVGTVLTKRVSKSLGEAPMLVFGTLLIALMPLTMYYNPQLYTIGVAAALSVIGGAMVGVAEGLLAERLLNEDELKKYYSSIGFVSIIPILLLSGLAGFIAQVSGLQMLFLCIGIMLALIIMPLYFIIVVIIDAEYRREKALRKKNNIS